MRKFRLTALMTAFLMLAAFGLYGCPKTQTGVQEETPSTTQMPPSETTEQAGTETGTTGMESTPGAGTEAPEVELPTAVEKLQDVYFDFDKSNIKSSQAAILDDDANWIKAHPDKFIILEGHCDERGTVAYNLALGERRANAVRDYLVSLGIDRSRLKTVSYGEERPVDPGHNEAAWAKNRRVHFLASSTKP